MSDTELEKELRLQAFRAEIKTIKQKDNRGLLRKITNVDELQPEEMVFWENWKNTFHPMERFFEIVPFQDLDKERKKLNDFLTDLKNLNNSLRFKDTKVSSTRSEFLSWLRNLIGRISGSLEGLASGDGWDPFGDLKRVKEAIQALREELF